MEKEIRLQKFLADAGIASRRKSEELILQGTVKVNEQVVTSLGNKVCPGIDKVEYQGKEVNIDNEKIYILLNKPIGYVTTVKEQFHRDSVMDLINIKQRVVPVRKVRHVHIWCINFDK